MVGISLGKMLLPFLVKPPNKPKSDEGRVNFRDGNRSRIPEGYKALAKMLLFDFSNDVLPGKSPEGVMILIGL